MKHFGKKVMRGVSDLKKCETGRGIKLNLHNGEQGCTNFPKI
jgi:hypothetical protein